MLTKLPTLPSFRLDGRRALVTGAGRGLGLACAAALAQAGAHVTLAARTQADLELVASAVRAAGGQADVLVLDVTNTAEVVSKLGAAARDHGPFQVVVHNAGTNRPATLADTPDHDIDAVMDLNVKASMVVLREVARGLMAMNMPGSLITMSSQMGHVGGPRRVVYCATKHAVEGMTKALAWELGPQGIRVNTVCPTFIETDMTRPSLSDPAFRAQVTSKIALGRLGQIEDIMGAVVFLASDASLLVTGSALMVDGGWTAA